MKLPNSKRAIIESQKLAGYCLNPEHPDGQHKARVFQSALGLGKENESELCQALKEAVQNDEAVFDEENQYGKKYVIDFLMTRGERQAIVRSVWLVRNDENIPRLVTCYVL